MTRPWISVAVLGLLVAAGCATRAPVVEPIRLIETRVVTIPVPVARTPPAELLAPLRPPLPMFVAPSDPQVSSALTIEGERLLRALITELLSRIDAWRLWAVEPLDTPTVPSARAIGAR